MKAHTQPLSERTKRHEKVIRTVVPDFRDFMLHPHPESPDGLLTAVDIFAPIGSRVRAPLPGTVVNAGFEDDPPPDNPGSGHLHSFLKLPDGRELPFVLGHLQRSTFKPAGKSFKTNAKEGCDPRKDKALETAYSDPHACSSSEASLSLSRFHPQFIAVCYQVAAPEER
jgi:hypothetical protein